MFVILRKDASYSALPQWRRNMWRSGMVLASAISLTPLLGISSNFIPSGYADGFSGLYGFWILGSCVCAPLSILFLGFGIGKSRWLGVLSPALSAPFLYLGLMAMTTVI